MVGQDTFQISVYFCRHHIHNRPVHFKPTVRRQIKVLIILKERFLKSIMLPKVTLPKIVSKSSVSFND
jgi:hypothetical protein